MIIFFGDTASLNPCHLGGSHSIIRRFSQYASEKKIDLQLVTFGDLDNNSVKFEGITWHQTTNVYYAIRELVQLDCKNLIYLYIPLYLRLLFLIFFRILKSKSKVSKFALEYKLSKGARLVTFLESLLCSGFVYAISDRVAEMYPVDKVRRFYPPLPASFGPTNKIIGKPLSLTIGYFGRFCDGKGYPDLPNIFEFIHKYETDVEFFVSGYGELKNKYDPSLNLTEERVKKDKWSVSFDYELATKYQKNDVLILPYRSLDTTIDCPLVVVEALFLGLVIFVPNNLKKLLLDFSGVRYYQPDNLHNLLKHLYDKPITLTDDLTHFEFSNSGNSFFSMLPDRN